MKKNELEQLLAKIEKVESEKKNVEEFIKLVSAIEKGNCSIKIIDYKENRVFISEPKSRLTKMILGDGENGSISLKPILISMVEKLIPKIEAELEELQK